MLLPSPNHGHNLDINTAVDVIQITPRSQLKTHSGAALSETDVNHVYKQITIGRKNIFSLPTGKHGKELIAEMNRLLQVFLNNASGAEYALTAFFIVPALLLQKTHAKCKARENLICLGKRLELWHSGQVSDLCSEFQQIQRRLNRSSQKAAPDHARRFSQLVANGKLSAASRMIDETESTLLDVNEDLVKAMQEKHPDAAPLSEDSLLQGPELKIHSSIFSEITGDTISKIALKCQGGAGPSGLDSEAAKRMLCSSNFSPQNRDLCSSLAHLARKLATEEVDPSAIEPFVSGRLIGLDKNPGVRPIAIGEIFRRIVSSSILSSLRHEIQSAAGTLQLCAGQVCGIESAIHAMDTLYNDDDTQCVLLVDADNAFNRLNRATALYNMRVICPEMYRFLHNTYQQPANLYLGSHIIKSKEGVTQGDVCAMAMYALAISPLVYDDSTGAKKIWYADDAGAAGRLEEVLEWWKMLKKRGPSYGFYPKPAKTILIVKPGAIDRAKQLFSADGITVTDKGGRYLGGAIGTTAYQQNFAQEKISSWVDTIERLGEIAKSQPHAAYSCYTLSIQRRWSFFQRISRNSPGMFDALERSIHNTLISSLFGCEVSDEIRSVLSLPVRNGGLSIQSPSIDEKLFDISRNICAPVISQLLNQQRIFIDHTRTITSTRNAAKTDNKRLANTAMQERLQLLPPEMSYCIQLSTEKGASAWLSSRPSTTDNTHLSKAEFVDAIRLRYHLQLNYMPSLCVCGEPNDITHALSCKTGGFVIRRHNNIRDLYVSALSDTCYDVRSEPPLQQITTEVLSPSSNIADDARLDVSCRSFWRDGQRAFFDIRVFNPLAPSNRRQEAQSTYITHEKEKCRQYQQRINEVEHGSFTPLVYSALGGCSPLTTAFHKRLASHLSNKKGIQYSIAIRWLRIKISFSLLRSTLLCVRGTRKLNTYIADTDILLSHNRVTL